MARSTSRDRIAMAIFTLGFNFVVGLQPDFTFLGASYPGYDPRSGTSWVVAGPTVTYEGSEGPVTLTETYWYLFGNGFDIDLNALPTTGTINSLVHGTPYEDSITGVVPPPAALDIGTFYLDRAFAMVQGLNILAADFAAAVAAGTIDDLLLAGDDLFRDPTSPTAPIIGPVWLRGGAGADTIYGGGRDATLWGESGDDMILIGDSGTPTPPGAGSVLDGATGDDTLTGGAWGDFILGGEGVDRLTGQRGNDTLNGGLERDVIRAGGGDDLLIASAGEVEAGEVLDGGTGSDWLAAFGDVAPLDLSDVLITGIERLEINGALAMTRALLMSFQRLDIAGLATLTLTDAGLTDLTGTAWYGFSVNSRLSILGTAGRDVITGRDSIDVPPTIPGYVAYGANDQIAGLAGNDVLNGGSGNDTLTGDAGNDLLRGDGGIDQLAGGEGADTLDTGGNPTPPFSFQNDVLDGGAGNDTYIVRHFNTTILEAAGGGTDTIVVYNAWTLPGEVENLTIGTTTALNGFGNALANRITGNDAFNNLSGAEGHDTLLGRGAGDVLHGGDGNDSLDGGDGDDVLIGDLGLDRLRGGAGADQFLFFGEQDSTPTTRDQILDFVSGEDRIALNVFDANALLEGLQSFAYIGSAAFIAGQPGQLRYQEVNATSCILFGNTDNDVAPEFAVLVVGVGKISEDDLLLPG
ncbi:MAG: M10 family metallopeptidase C-terminal domain-containing protein [Alphaproteobacteria bacterium]|nr:M10 family metallopeptidase C-terminal domain-containing protein [Alphaproteobacteria bacterium]